MTASKILPPFGDPRLSYETVLDQASPTEIFPRYVGGELVKTQLMVLNELPIYAIKSGDDPLTERELYEAYLASLEGIAKQTEIMRAELLEMKAANDNTGNLSFDAEN